MIDRILSINAGQAEFLLRFLFPQLESEQAVTEKIFLAVPAGQEFYRPNEKAMTAFGYWPGTSR